MAVSISIGITQNGQSVANNTSNVTVTVTAKWTGGSHNSVISGDGKPQARGWVKIDGTQYNFESTFNTSETTSGSQTICEKTLNISHASNGSKTLSCSASYSTGVSSGTVTASASKALTTIARKSTLLASDGTLGTSQTLTVSKYSTSYTHTITYKCGSASGTIVTKSASTSISFTPPISLASQSKNSLYVPVVFTITTYSGDDSLGSTTKTINCYISDSADTNPTVSISVSDEAGCFSTYGGFIQKKSKLHVVLTESGKQGASIESRSTAIAKVVNGVETVLEYYSDKSFTTDVISTAGALKITTTVIDSRGRKAVATTTISVLEYSAPQITNLSAYRADSNGNTDEAGEILRVVFDAKVSALNNKNTADYYLKFRKVGSGEYTTLPIASLENVYNASGFFVAFTADKSSSYDISVIVEDAFGEIEKSTTGQTATKAWSMFAKGLGWAFGKYAEIKNTLDVAWNIIARKNIYMGYYNDAEKNIFLKNNAAHTGKTYASNKLYPHNCKFYGGSANSTTAIGLYDSRKSKGVFVYDDHNDYVKTQVNIRQHIFQAHQKDATKISSNGWNKIKLGASTDTGLNPTLDNVASTRYFELTTGGGIKCNCNGYVMVSGQLYLTDLTSGDIAGACISQESKDENNNSTNTNLAWNYVKHEVSSAYVPVMPIVVAVKKDDVFFLNGRNFDKTYGTAAVSGTSGQTTRLIVQYVG